MTVVERPKTKDSVALSNAVMSYFVRFRERRVARCLLPRASARWSEGRGSGCKLRRLFRAAPTRLCRRQHTVILSPLYVAVKVHVTQSSDPMAKMQITNAM